MERIKNYELDYIFYTAEASKTRFTLSVCPVRLFWLKTSAIIANLCVDQAVCRFWVKLFQELFARKSTSKILRRDGFLEEEEDMVACWEICLSRHDFRVLSKNAANADISLREILDRIWEDIFSLIRPHESIFIIEV